ncbi:MAG: DUF3883 domain-containing protein [Planctomycetota bacterium]|jgi:superfamily II DNA or RNA helicase|nr:DUF3883 domain-containing protein [Planctomycetota bacterium]
MVQLEEITAGGRIGGLAGKEPVSVVAVKWYGTGTLDVTYKDDRGQLGSRLVTRENEAEFELVGGGLPWSFDADADQLRLVSEAWRIHLAHLFDPYLAVHTSDIEPLPHQIAAVYREMLGRLPLRYLLADDPGAGKTVMTGLFLKELLARGDLRRCLIVVPGSLIEQWQDELFRKFNLRFEILTNDRIEASVTGNVFREMNYCLARLDKLARNDVVREKLAASDWDLIVCDEAHKMSATIWGGEIKATKRFQLGQLLSGLTRHFLLLTATPHNGKNEDFQLFLSLLDRDRFGGVVRTGARASEASDVMRRLVKEELRKFDGFPLFPERLAYTLNYDLSPDEAALYAEVTNYVQVEFDRADRLNNERKTTVGFALTILQRRLASSPEAIWQSLRRRRERLERRLAEEKLGRRAEESRDALILDDYDEDDLPSGELEEVEEVVADKATAASTLAELEAEILTLRRLEGGADRVRASGRDRKWDELSGLLQDNQHLRGPGGRPEKLIVFTEHRDTLRYLAGKIRSLLGSDGAVAAIHGGLAREERRRLEALFKQDRDACVLVATDAAGEGVNLQQAHLMVNYDLPWNPNRLEQRFGRIHRIGQTEVCHLWNLVARETREGMVFDILLHKLEQARQTLGGKVFNILGKLSFENRPLRELLIEAIRYGDDPARRAKIELGLNASLEFAELDRLLRDRALAESVLDARTVLDIREDMERREAHKLQPHFIEAFFVAAFRSLGGKILPRETRRYEIPSVPANVRERGARTGLGDPVLPRYERVCFDKADRNRPGLVPADLVCPGHPLLEAVIDLLRERHRDVLKRGALFIDENDFSEAARLLFYIEDAIQDGIGLPAGGKRVISRRVHFVELREDGAATNPGYAPYLDYRAATLEERETILPSLKKWEWLKNDLEDRVCGYAVENILPAHLAEVRRRRESLIEKTERAVRERLTAEIQYWDFRAAELKRKEASGYENARINSRQAAGRAEELAARLQKRLEELAREKQISLLPPVITGGALVLPLGLLRRLIPSPEGTPAFSPADPAARRAVEQAALRAVLAAEAELGFEPRDVSSEKRGYDVESRVPEPLRRGGASLRFIEVKGRVKGAAAVTVTKNEILTALNKPEEFILALVEVDGGLTRTRYLKKPFHNPPDFAVTHSNYAIGELIANSEIVHERLAGDRGNLGENA